MEGYSKHIGILPVFILMNLLASMKIVYNNERTKDVKRLEVKIFIIIDLVV